MPLTGARGTGKSSLIKACLNAYAKDGLRLIEVDKDDLHDLGDIVDLIAKRPETLCRVLRRPLVRRRRVGLQGAESRARRLGRRAIGQRADLRDVEPPPSAARVHERQRDLGKHTSDGEIHPGELVEEKISLSERFGLWVSFYPFKQDDYLSIIAHWLRHFGCNDAEVEAARGDALVWALERGSRSGRVAWQFARDWSGRKAQA